MFSRKSTLLLAICMVFTTITFAQPGGGPGGHPGGFPGGGRPPMGRPGDGPRQGNPNMNPNDQRSSTVKQKKRVTEGSTFKIIGSLRDSISGETLPFVNLSVITKADSTFVKGGSSDFDGNFELTGIPAGEYFLRVSAIGYQSFFMPITVSNNTALGTLKIKPGATTLKEVVITESRPIYAMDGEKMIYNVSDDPTIQTGTTSDALQNAPGVEVDIEGNVTLRGVSSVEIWINDKPSKLTEENLKTYLETLPANALARIEAISNPSAKYATSAEAVINIVTTAHIKSNQFVSFGINGSSQPFVSPWISYMWAKEKLSINLYASGRYNYNKNEGYSRSYMRKDNASVPGAFDTIQFDSTYSYSKSNRLNGNLFLDINYEIDSSSDIEFSLGGNYGHPNSESYSTSLRDQTYAGLDSYLYYDTNINKVGGNYFGHAGVDYTKKFDNEGHNLRVSARTMLNGNNSESINSRTFDGTIYTIPTPDQGFNKMYRSHSNSQNYSINARYNRPYSKDGELSFGLGYDHDKSHSIYDRIHLDPSTSEYTVTDELRSYEYRSVGNNLNADVNWTRRWGGFTCELGFGVRYENTHFSYENDYYPDDTTFNYLTYNPSIHLSYRTESMHNFKLNYTLRMSNPNESQLTTFRSYSEDSYRVGNRDLTAPLTHNAEIGWTKFFEKFGNIGIDGYLRYSANEIDNLTDVTDGIDPYINRAIQYSMPYNMGSSYRYGLSANVTYRPTGFFNLRFYANAYNSGYTMFYEKLGKEVSDNMFSYSLRLNGWAKVFDKYQVHASINYSSPTQGLFSKRKANYNFNLGVRADFFKRKLSAFINIQDLFNWGARFGSGSENTNPYLLSESTNKRLNSRFISAGITLRFGKMELERQAKDGSSITSDSE